MSSKESKIDESVPVAKEKAKTPPIIKTIAMMRSRVPVADISP